MRLFYELLAQRRYADMRGLVTGDLYARLPDVSSLDARTPPGKLRVDRAELTERSPNGNRAIVSVDVVEESTLGPASMRRYTGTWTLERGPSGWLLAESDLQTQ